MVFPSMPGQDLRLIKTLQLKGEAGKFDDMAFSADSSMAAVTMVGPTVAHGNRSTQKKGAAVYVAPAFERVTQIPVSNNHPHEYFEAIALSPGSEYLALGLSDGNVHIHDWPHYKKLVALTQHKTHAIGCIAFSPDKRFLATTGDDKKTLLYTMPDFELVHTFESGVHSKCKFSPDSTYLAVSSKDSVKLWNIPGFDRKKEFDVDRQPVCTFSQDMRYFAVMDGQTCVYELPKLKKVETFKANVQDAKEKDAFFCCFSPDNRYFANIRSSTEVYSTAAFTCLKRFEHHTHGFGYGGFTPDSKNLVTLGPGEIIVYDEQDSFTPLRTIKFSEPFFSIAPDKRQVITSPSSSVLNVWEINLSYPLAQPL